jgi:hypothetical protein
MTTHSARIREMHGPVDRVAARVMQGGVHYEREVHPAEKHWKDLHDVPPLVPFKPQPGNPQSIDYTGTKFGRFTVVGYLGATGPGLGKRGKRMAVWLVRCACSSYSQRTVKAIRNPDNAEDCCNDCRNLEYLKRGRSFKALPKAMK